jgi:hypothetical protein
VSAEVAHRHRIQRQRREDQVDRRQDDDQLQNRAGGSNPRTNVVILGNIFAQQFGEKKIIALFFKKIAFFSKLVNIGENM